MNRKILVEFSEDNVSIDNVYEDDNSKDFIFYDGKSSKYCPEPLLEFFVDGNFSNLSGNDNNYYPFKLSYPNSPTLSGMFESMEGNINIKRTINNKIQYQSGYLLMGGYYETINGVKSLRINFQKNMWYNETIKSTDFSNPNYKFKNPLDDFNKHIKEFNKGRDNKFLFVFLMGDSLDFQNTNKIVYNETNIGLSKLIPIDDFQTVYPLDFLRDMKSRLDLDYIYNAIHKNRYNGQLLSTPRGFNITYFGKYDNRDSNNIKIIEETILYNNRTYSNKEYHIPTTLNLDSGINKEHPSTFYQEITNLEKSYLDKNKDNKVLLGFHYYSTFNITNINHIEIEKTFVDDSGIKGEYKPILIIGEISSDIEESPIELPSYSSINEL